MNFNLTTTSYNDLNPMMLQNYVTVDQCKDFVASTTRNNYLLMGLLLLFGVAMLVWINRDKIGFFKSLKQKKEMMSMMSDPESLEMLGSQFGKFLKGEEIIMPEVKKGEESRDKNIHNNIEERSDLHREDEQYEEKNE